MENYNPFNKVPEKQTHSSLFVFTKVIDNNKFEELKDEGQENSELTDWYGKLHKKHQVFFEDKEVQVRICQLGFMFEHYSRHSFSDVLNYDAVLVKYRTKKEIYNYISSVIANYYVTYIIDSINSNELHFKGNAVLQYSKWYFKYLVKDMWANTDFPFKDFCYVIIRNAEELVSRSLMECTNDYNDRLPQNALKRINEKIINENTDVMKQLVDLTNQFYYLTGIFPNKRTWKTFDLLVQIFEEMKTTDSSQYVYDIDDVLSLEGIKKLYIS